MDLTWLFFILCPYMFVYFYLNDFLQISRRKIMAVWLLGLGAIILAYFILNKVNPYPAPFPAPLYKS
ncbi:MAG TPA: hypothetical protein PK728_05300 [Bacillota bacterium]|nr:hypothetical protein [Bacillota bacterium]